MGNHASGCILDPPIQAMAMRPLQSNADMVMQHYDFRAERGERNVVSEAGRGAGLL
jgi:hypothetical protein